MESLNTWEAVLLYIARYPQVCKCISSIDACGDWEPYFVLCGGVPVSLGIIYNPLELPLADPATAGQSPGWWPSIVLPIEATSTVLPAVSPASFP